jgi:hypothetical protein
MERWNMNKLFIKYKCYLLCFIVLLIVGIGFALYSSSQEKKTIEQKQNIEKYVDSMMGSEKNITSKLKSIKNGSTVTIGDYNYIAEQIKNIGDCYACLYSFEYNKVTYLDEYAKSLTNYETYEKYYNYLNSKYSVNDHDNYNKTAQKLIDSAKIK